MTIPVNRLVRRLRDGGWKPETDNRFWTHPNGETFILQSLTHFKDHDTYTSCVKQIERSERKKTQGDSNVMTLTQPRKTAIVTTWYDWVKDCRKTGGYSQKEVEVLLGFHAGMVCQIEQGKRKFSIEEWKIFQDGFPGCELPEGLKMPLASQADMNKRGPRAPKQSSLFDELRKVEVPAPVQPETILVKKEIPIMSPTPAPISVPALVNGSGRINRASLVAEANKLLSCSRLTDLEIKELVAMLKDKVVNLLTADLS